MQLPPVDEPSLTRFQIIGALARAAQLAMQESEHADGCFISIIASPEGVSIEVEHHVAGVPVSGWGQ